MPEPPALPPGAPFPRGYRRAYHRTVAFAKGTYHTVDYLTSNEVYIFTSAIAFNVLLAVFPYLIVIVTAARTLFPGWGLDAALLEVIAHYLPAGEEFIVRNISAASVGWGQLTAISAVLTLLAGAGLFVPIEIALNRALGRTGQRNIIASNAVSFSLFLACGAVFFIATMLAALPLRLFTYVFGFIPFPAVHHVLSFIAAKLFTVPATCFCFFLIYWALPLPPRPSWRRMLPAGIAMGLLWEASKFLYVYALPLFEFKKYYGPFYITLSLITWAFFSGFILLLGPHLVARNLLPVIAPRRAESAPAEDEPAPAPPRP